MANKCVVSAWPNPVRGRAGGLGMRCKSGKTGRFIPNRNCRACPPSLDSSVKRSGAYTIPSKYRRIVKKHGYSLSHAKPLKRGRRRR